MNNQYKQLAEALKDMAITQRNLIILVDNLIDKVADLEKKTEINKFNLK